MEVAERTETQKRITPNQKSSEQRFPFYRKGSFYGLLAGFGMGIFLAAVNGMVENVHTGWSLAKYAILGIVLGFALNRYKNVLPTGKTFKNGILLGAFISLTAAATLIVINTVINLTGIDALTTTRYNLEADSLAKILIIDGALLFECLVFGMLLTFIWLQLLKEPKPAE